MRKLSEEKLIAERERLEQMKAYEQAYASYSAICGIDEAGRGPLAGPVVAGAVILPKDCEILFLNDSGKSSCLECRYCGCGSSRSDQYFAGNL